MDRKQAVMNSWLPTRPEGHYGRLRSKPRTNLGRGPHHENPARGHQPGVGSVQMGVDAAAGSSDVVDDIRSEVSETMAAAQQVLSHRFGATVRLAAPEDLGGSGESTVIRVRVAATPFSLPRTLVVKRYGPPEPGAVSDAFVQEAVSYQLFTALASEERMCPEMFAARRAGTPCGAGGSGPFADARGQTARHRPACAPSARCCPGHGRWASCTPARQAANRTSRR